MPPPQGVYVLIKTVTGCVRVAKYILYNNSTESWQYGSTYYKNVMWWQPLPKWQKQRNVTNAGRNCRFHSSTNLPPNISLGGMWRLSMKVYGIAAGIVNIQKDGIWNIGSWLNVHRMWITLFAQMNKEIKFVLEIVVNYLWMVSVKKFCLGALGSSCPNCIRAFLFTAWADCWLNFGTLCHWFRSMAVRPGRW